MNSLPADKNRRVLVIDDNRAIHDDFRKILSPASTVSALDATEAALFGRAADVLPQTQFTVDSACQGQEGVLRVKTALAAGQPYALAFVDVRMPPGWDGVETTRNLWALDPHLQVVICTAYSDYSWGSLFQQLGHSDGLLILKKPFDAVEAFQLAHALTEKWWLHQMSRQKMQDLESRVAGRTRELASSLSMLHATLESTPDGIVAVDLSGKVIACNSKFAAIWHPPAGMPAHRPSAEMPAYVSEQVKDSTRFIQRSKTLQAAPEIENLDVIELKDGRTFERYVFPQRIDGQCVGTVVNWRDITARKQAEEALRVSDENFHQLADNITDAFWIRSPDLRQVHYVSPAFERIWARSVKSLYANPEQWTESILPEDRERVLDAFAALTRDAPSLDIEYRIARPDGGIRWVRVRGFQVRDAARNLIRHTGIASDITDRKRVEAQLLQSQKMETVGKLAGGIAHEFNSILTAIIGQSELIRNDLSPDNPLVLNAASIHKAAERAATLTRQLLAFGRRSFLRPEWLDLNEFLASMDDSIRHLVGSTVDVRIVPSSGLHTVEADAGQLGQVIMNLVMNAADAMPKGGILTLETANVSFDLECLGRDAELKPGNYVRLAITDTGSGMSDSIKARALEPFFTTKDVGQGTGLGLPTAYGILKQSGGHLSVYSELGRGTTFKIYLPQVVEPATFPVQQLDPRDLPRGTETILLVEDDPALREMAAILLRRLGYTVFTAGNGLDAMNLRQQQDIAHIDLLFTDVVMPHMSGKELADRVRSSSPHTRILFTSAFTENAILHQEGLDPGVALLQKPFTPSALAHKLREVLNSQPIPHAT